MISVTLGFDFKAGNSSSVHIFSSRKFSPITARITPDVWLAYAVEASSQAFIVAGSLGSQSGISRVYSKTQDVNSSG